MTISEMLNVAAAFSQRAPALVDPGNIILTYSALFDKVTHSVEALNEAATGTAIGSP